MDTANILGVLAVLCGVAGYAVYAKGIIDGKIKPHAFSWFVWALLTGIAYAIQMTEGGGAGAWVTGVTALFCFVFFLVGLGASSRLYITSIDWFYFAGALAAIPLWFFTSNPLLAVLLITLIDAIAFAPTFRKAYYNPETESLWQSSLASVKFAFGLAALSTITLSTALYPASLVLMNAIFFLMILWRRARINTK
ncbi:MAG: hypothetical protein RLZZ283_170 [Candidatus Parcubacteria bacterium]